MSFFKNLFPKSKEKKHKEDLDYLSKNYNTLIDYWGGIIARDIKLEDGSTFSDGTFYNTKYLKYRKDLLEKASIYNAKTTKDKKVYYACRTCYIWFANFNDKIKDKVSNDTDEILDIVNTTDPSDTQSLIDKIAKLPQDEKKSKELFKSMQKAQLAYLKKFDELTSK
tara:strand:+ start:413 stop:913 length:501 start_codon:yes stop_codon:yes gene_type:complete